MSHYLITANFTRDGLSAYLVDETTWSHDVAQAKVVSDETQRDALLQVAARSQAVVTDPYAIDAAGPDGQPASFRERIRAQGPTVAMIGDQPQTNAQT